MITKTSKKKKKKKRKEKKDNDMLFAKLVRTALSHVELKREIPTGTGFTCTEFPYIVCLCCHHSLV